MFHELPRIVEAESEGSDLPYQLRLNNTESQSVGGSQDMKRMKFHTSVHRSGRHLDKMFPLRIGVTVKQRR